MTKISLTRDFDPSNITSEVDEYKYSLKEPRISRLFEPSDRQTYYRFYPKGFADNIPFTPRSENGKISFIPLEGSNEVPDEKCTIPIVVDSEYKTIDTPYWMGQNSSRTGLLVQTYDPATDSAFVFRSRDLTRMILNDLEGGRLTQEQVESRMKWLENHHQFESGFIAVEHLKACGHDTELYRLKDFEEAEIELPFKPSDLPVMTFKIYAHFAVAEMKPIFQGGFLDDINQLYRVKEPTRMKLEMDRRLKASVTGANNFVSEIITMPWVITVDNKPFQVGIKIIDTSAIHGQASYAAIAETVGFKLPSKDKLTQQEKSRMDETTLNRYEDVYQYSIGDLYVLELLRKNAELMTVPYERLGLEDYYTIPRLTIGSTMSRMLESSIKKILQIPVATPDMEKEEVEKIDQEVRFLKEEYMDSATSEHLRSSPTQTRALLSKTHGGRCRNNQPLTIRVGKRLNWAGNAETAGSVYATDVVSGKPERLITDKVAIVDMDIGGAYGEGMRNQDFFIGKPEIYDYNVGENFDPVTLKKFRYTHYKGELTHGAWFAVVSTRPGYVLRHEQDFLMSFYLANGEEGEDVMGQHIKKLVSDTENEGFDYVDEFDPDEGVTKVLTRQVANAVIGHDFLDWLDYVCSKSQRDELEANLVIKAAIVYPKSKEVRVSDNHAENYQELRRLHALHAEKSTIKRRRGKIIREDGQYHGFIRIPLSDLQIDELLYNRKQFKKKSPENTIFKLCVNTTYGDLVSKFFPVSNVVVGNNITARTRALAWYMEKLLNCYQVITDGGMFDMNRVVYTRTVKGKAVPLTAHKLTGMYADPDPRGNRNLRIAPLGGYENIQIEWVWMDNLCDKKGKPVPGSLQVRLHLHQKDGTIEYVEPIVKQHDNGRVEIKETAMAWVDKVSMEHMRNIYPEVELFKARTSSITAKDKGDGTFEKVYEERDGQYILEGKNFYTYAVFKGASDYLAGNPEGHILRARSYEVMKDHGTIVPGSFEDITALIQEGNLERAIELGKRMEENHLYSRDSGLVNLEDKKRRTFKLTPALKMMNDLWTGKPLERQYPFVKEGILKPGDFQSKFGTFNPLGLMPGDTYYKAGLMREFTTSAFTFQTIAQWVAFDKMMNRRKIKHGQTIEGFFMEGDRLDYDRMIEYADKAIRATRFNRETDSIEPECMNILEDERWGLDRARNRARKKGVQEHPSYPTLLKLKERMKTPKVKNRPTLRV